MRNAFNAIREKITLERLAVTVVFGAYLIIGLCIFDDYGISWDEHDQHYLVGTGALRVILEGDTIEGILKYYGPAFELVLVLATKAVGDFNSRAIFLTRHLVTFLAFYAAVLAFYWILRQRFQSWQVGLVGVLFLILSPRIFADSFYNCKDLGFLSFYLLALATLLKYLQNRSRPTIALLHALASAFVLDIRILAILLVAITVFFILLHILVDRWQGNATRWQWLSLLTYVVALVPFVFAFWPTLWREPTVILRALPEMSKFPWPGEVLYMGQFVSAQQLPWHYIPVWLTVTTPLWYTALFPIGLAVFLASLLRGPWQAFRQKLGVKKLLAEAALSLSQHSFDAACFLTVFTPVAMVILLGSVVYDGWRHLFFIYPAFLYFALLGLVTLLRWARQRNWRILHIALLATTMASLGHTAWTMVRYHPHENVYFNFLAGPNLREIRNRFEMDYWGLSYRQVLEGLLKLHPTGQIHIRNYQYGPEFRNMRILPYQQRMRLRYHDDPEDCMYSLSCYRGHPGDFSTTREAYAVKVDGANICVAVRLRD